MADTKALASLFDTITYDGQDALNIFAKYHLIEQYKSSIQYSDEYTITEGDRWDILAYKLYGTPFLWWTIAIFNNVVDPFQTMEPGTKIKIIKPSYVSEVLLALRRAKRSTI